MKEKVFNFLYKLASSTGTTAIKSRTFALAHHSAIQMDHGNSSFSVSRGNSLNYTVVDLRGRSTLIGRVSAGESVDLSSLSNGVYMLKVTCKSGNVYISRVVVK